MKRIVIALLVLMTIFSLANAQKQTTVINDSTGNVKVTVTKDKDAKTNAGNTAVTVVGMDDEDADTTHVSTSKASTLADRTEKQVSPSFLTMTTSRSIISEMQSEEAFW